MRTPHPPLRWAGGKRQLLGHLLPLVPEKLSAYHEPFLGGGALFFELSRIGRITPETDVVLGDSNKELIACYQQIRDYPGGVISALREWEKAEEQLGSEVTYKTVRSSNFTQPEKQAAKLFYLNRTCYNGLYRVNKKGQFNVPWGKKPFKLTPEMVANLEACRKALNTAVLLPHHWGHLWFSLPRPTRQTLFFFDPPYLKENSLSFVGYNSRKFLEEAHMQLAAWAVATARNPEITVIITSSDTPRSREIYDKTPFNMVEVPVRRAINSNGSGRTGRELIFHN